MRKKNVFLILLQFLIVICVSCNIFDWTTTSEDEVYYEGLKLFNEGQFAEAREKFAEAIENDPTRSDYRYYHAKATILADELDFYTIARRIINIDSTALGKKLPLYTKEPEMTLEEDRVYKNGIYQTTLVCHDDVSPIFFGRTHGTIDQDYVAFEFSILSMARAILQLRDTNNDKAIDENDIYIILKTYINPLNNEELYLPDMQAIYDYLIESDENRQGFNSMLSESAKYATEGIAALVNTFSDTLLFKNDDLENIVEKIEITSNYYRVNDGIDNDNDNLIDEEIINFLDDDGDGRTDEDSHL